MRKLQDTELFSLHFSETDKANIEYAVINKLSKSNIGVIAPEQIAPELTQLKIKAKSGTSGFLSEAIALYEGLNGRIRLFNLGTSSLGRSPIPIYIPFVPAMARNRSLENDSNARPTTPAVFMNMYRVGNWNATEDAYIGFSAITDLYCELESGAIMYKMLVDGQANKVLGDKKILDTLTRIYTFMFTKALTKSLRTVTGGDDFLKPASEFLIANFFLKYIIGMSESETMYDYAYNATSGRASLTALRDFSESSNIDYTSLSGFLKTMGAAVYNEEVSLIKFQMGWITTFGEGLLFAIEYLPYLIHYLIALVRGSSLGETSRLIMHKQDINKRGLDLFYRSLISILR